MKNIKPVRQVILLLLILTGTCTNIEAQMSIGISGGYNSQNFNQNRIDSVTFKRGNGYVFGLSIDFSIKNDVKINLSPGFVFEKSIIGVLDSISTPESDYVDYKDSLELNFSYFTLPVLAKIISNNEKWFFTAGPELLIPMSLNIKNGSETIDWSNLLNELNVIATLGIGYNFYIKNSVLSIEFRYGQSLNRITDDSDNIFSPANLKTKNSRLLFTWSIPLSKNE